MSSRWVWVFLVSLAAALAAEVSETPAIDDDLKAVGGGVELVDVAPVYGALAAERFKLPNGLDLIFLRDTSAPVISVQTWLRVGSRHETQGRTGLAHLFEHLMFRATKNHEDGEFDRMFEERGCQTNADTWCDRTRYYEDLAREHLDIALELEADRLVNLILDEATFRDELDVVMNERRQSVEDDPWGELDEEFTAALFGRDHPYGWPTLGWMADLEAMTHEAAADFYRAHYAPNSVTLIVAGDVTRREVLTSVVRHYAALAPAPTTPPTTPEAPSRASVARRELELDFVTDRVMLGWVTCPRRHTDAPALELAAAILFDGETSRLGELVLRDRPIASETSVFLAPFAFAGSLQITVALLEGHRAEAAEAAIAEVLEEVTSGTKPITSAELEGARSRTLLAAYSGMVTTHGKAAGLGESLIALGDPTGEWRRLEGLAAIDIEAITKAVKTYLTPERRAVVIARAPQPAAETNDGAPLDQAVDIITTTGGVAMGPGGARVLVETDMTLPFVEVSITSRRGAACDPPERAGLTSFAASALARGAAGRSRTEIEAELERLGAEFSVDVDADSVTYSSAVLAADLDAWLALAADLLLRPDFPAAELEKLRRERLTEFAALVEDDDALAASVFNAALFEGTPYGLLEGGTPRSLQAISRDDLLGWHAQLEGRDLVFAASGAVDLVRFHASVMRHWSQIPGSGSAPLPAVAVSTAALARGLNVVIVDKPDRTQSRWILGSAAPGWREGPFEALEIANTTFGGTFKARLNDELRVKNGWTYGAFSWHDPARGLGAFKISSATETSVTLPALARTLEMFGEWIVDGLSDDELEQARSYLINEHPFTIDTAADRLENRVLELLEDLPADFHRGALDRLSGVSPEAVSEALKETVGAASARLLVVVGSAAAMREELAKLPEVGRVVVLDPSELGRAIW